MTIDTSLYLRQWLVDLCTRGQKPSMVAMASGTGRDTTCCGPTAPVFVDDGASMRASTPDITAAATPVAVVLQQVCIRCASLAHAHTRVERSTRSTAPHAALPQSKATVKTPERARSGALTYPPRNRSGSTTLASASQLPVSYTHLTLPTT